MTGQRGERDEPGLQPTEGCASAWLLGSGSQVSRLEEHSSSVAWGAVTLKVKSFPTGCFRTLHWPVGFLLVSE